ncbi:transcriptional regulator, AraC family [gut metagenome]|uniref:Transcriptional regulator, AraC family n=1 Tax=gut metagenome TaxID=749906 RepID=J9FS10_9ZZZZ
MSLQKIQLVTLKDLNNYMTMDYQDEDIALSIHHQLVQLLHPIKLDMVVMLICIKGTLKVSLHTVEYTLQPNDVMYFTPSARIQKVTGSDDLVCWGICLSTRIIIRFLGPNNDLRDKFFYLIKHPVYRISMKCMSILEEYKKLILLRTGDTENPYQKGIITSLTYSVFYELLANLKVCDTTVEKTLVRQGDILFEKFIELIMAQKVKVRSVSYYADKLFVSTKYLSAVCKQVRGKTAFKLINELVMDDITELLKYSEKSIKEIAEELEFPNISFFGKYIKSHTGMSTTEYRKFLINQL